MSETILFPLKLALQFIDNFVRHTVFSIVQ